MTANPIWAVVPVKPFPVAKARLASILNAAERATVARSMFEDVLDTITAARHLLGGILVLTADNDAAALARRQGAHVLHESAPAGINEALALAIEYLAETPEAGMLVIPTDIPHLSLDAIEKTIRALDSPRAVALVPATDDQGTNIFGCRPAGIIAPSFGPQSFQLHRQAALEADINPTVFSWPDLGRDIDRLEDLGIFLSFRTNTRTNDYLVSLDLECRLRMLSCEADPQAMSCSQ